MANIIRTIPEPNKTVDVDRECDVVVVGGGPGGIGAAVAAALSIGQGVSVRNVDFASLRRQLIAQNVPLPGVYPDKYKKGTQESVSVYTPPIFGERVPQKRTELPE